MLTNNVGIKIAAVIFAFIVWLAVVNINDPEKIVTVYSIPIEVTDNDVLKEQNMVYSSKGNYRVNITVSGKRSIVTNLTADDFKATASLKDLSKVNSIPVSVEAKNMTIARNITIMKQSVQTIAVDVEQITENDFEIEPEFHGSLADGYVLGEYSLYTNTVTIDAPTSVLDRIDKVAAICDIEDLSQDVSGRKCRIVLYDKDGERISLKKNNITLSISKVKINVSILKEVVLKIKPVTVDNIGTPAENCEITEVKMQQNTITVIGAADILETLTDLDISGEIDISKDESDVTKTVDVSKLLPQEVTITSGSIVSVEVKIDKYINKSITIDPTDVALLNVSDAIKAKVLSKNISIEFYGKEKDLNDVKSEDISVSIDLNGVVAEGTQDMKATVQCPDSISTVNDVSIKIKIEKK
jgi:YbbR domain-containing protein